MLFFSSTGAAGSIVGERLPLKLATANIRKMEKRNSAIGETNFARSPSM
jgi:hypothetical protein